MTAKDYLRQAYEAKHRIEEITSQIALLDDYMVKTGGFVLGGSKVQTSPLRDPTGSRLAVLMDEKMSRERQLRHWENICNTAVRTLNAVECITCYKVLHARYIRGLKLEEVADELNYTVSYVKKLHATGMREIKVVV